MAIRAQDGHFLGVVNCHIILKVLAKIDTELQSPLHKKSLILVLQDGKT